MRRRVGRNEALLPVGRRSCAVVALQGLAIVLPLIPEDGPAGIEMAANAHEQIPVVVADLMPEVAEQGAIRLAHGRAAPLALDIVGLAERDGDETLVMPGHHLGAIIR